MNIKKKLGYFISICCMSGLCLLPAASVSAKETEQTVSANSQEISVSADTVEISDTSDLDADATIVYSGKDGDLDWSIDSNGLLTISGTGDYTMTLPQWYEYKDTIKSAVVRVGGITKTSYMFYGCSNMISINLSEFDTSNVLSMQYMFSDCSGLTSLDLSGFNTSRVTEIAGMFNKCSGLTSLDVSGFDTSKVTNMSLMFASCSGLTSLDLSEFDTSNVLSMQYMFAGCSKLTSLDLNEFDTSKVTSMRGMFAGCSSLTDLDVSGFETSHVTDMDLMFRNCSSLTNLNVSGFETSQVVGMDSMFRNCSKLTSLDVSGFDTNQVTIMTIMFSGCSSLSSLDVSGFETSQVMHISGMFSGCSSLTSLDLSGFDTSKATNMSDMFSGCSSLASLDVSGFETSHVTNTTSMFEGCSSLTSLNLSGFDASKVENMSLMFSGCSNLRDLTVFANVKSVLDLPVVTDCNWYDPSGNICTTVKQGVNTPVTYIRRKTLKASNTVISDINAVYYIGSEIKPAVIVSCGNVKLKEGIDYTVSYENNIEPGTATAIITGKGNYIGTVRKSFVIKCHLNKSKIDDLEFTYTTGNLKKLNSKTFYSLYMDFRPVKYATTYEIELSDEKGKVIKTYTVECGKKDFIEKSIKKLPKDVYGVRIRGCRDGEYGEWSDRSFVVKQPKAQARNYKGAIQIKWQKLKGVSGYDIYLSKKQNSGYKKVASVNAKTTLKTIKKLGKKKLKKGTYYYYVVAKKKIGKKTYKSKISYKLNIKKK